MIQVLVSDGAGTLGLPSPSDDIRNLLRSLDEHGIKLAVASNAPRAVVESRFDSASLPVPSLIVTSADIGVKKPSPKFIDEIARQSGAGREQIVYLGDDEKTDIFCAINAGVLPIAASYSNPNLRYGIPVFHPRALQRYLETFAQQEGDYFAWKASSVCHDTGRPIDVRTLIFDHSPINLDLRSVLKHGSRVSIGSYDADLGQIIFQYLVSSCYQSGLMQRIDCVTVYPGHEAGSHSPILDEFSSILGTLFHRNYIEDLILRHTTAPKSQYQGANRSIINQLNTIHINPKYRRRIQDKRILVLDDYTTAGFSLETARQMLVRGGASDVTCLAIAKFRSYHSATRIGRDFNPYEPVQMPEEDVQVLRLQGRTIRSVDEYFFETILPVYRA